jgi:hypothetical protein
MSISGVQAHAHCVRAAEARRYCDTKSQVGTTERQTKDDSVLRSCPLSLRCGGVIGNDGVSSTQQALGNRVARWPDCGE